MVDIIFYYYTVDMQINNIHEVHLLWIILRGKFRVLEITCSKQKLRFVIPNSLDIFKHLERFQYLFIISEYYWRCSSLAHNKMRTTQYVSLKTSTYVYMDNKIIQYFTGPLDHCK